MDKMLAKIIRDNQNSLLKKWEQKILEQKKSDRRHSL